MKSLFCTLILLLLLVFGTSSFASPINEKKAKSVAITFATQESIKLVSPSLLSLVYAKENAFYVFGNQSGFVIVAADDRVTPILGYSNEGPFIVPTDANDTTRGNNFWGLMNSFEQQIAYVVDNNISATDDIATQWSALLAGQSSRSMTTVVPPLLTTTWDQGWPYNSMCPVDASGPGGHVWAGCAATALAQILKYHNYPSQGLGSYGYQWGSYPATTANFGATTYNWTNMPNSISAVNTDVATLIYQSAVSLRSMWGASSTGVGYITYQDPMTRALPNYFKFAFAGLQYVEKVNYTATQWDNLIQTELLANRPVFYRGDGSGGHAFVCDGVDASNLYHFNWGWGGSYNGYFTLATLNPGGNNYSNNQGAIIGIKPNDGSTLVANTTWSSSTTLSMSTAVPDAITLTVSAGATVKFAQNCKLQIWGKVISTGTSSSYATFTAVDTTTGWSGIKFDNLYMNNEVMSDNDSSKFVYTQIQYSKMRGVTIKNFSKVVFDHCKINNNFIDGEEYGYYYGQGAGIFVEDGTVRIFNSDIYNNHAVVTGGGIRIVYNATPISYISNNHIYGNAGDATGGGVYLQCAAMFTNNIVDQNSSYQGAGAALAGGIGMGIMSITNNKFCNNSTIGSTGKGGGLYFDQACAANVVDNLFANNFAKKGSALCITGTSTPLILNCTVSSNSTETTSTISLSNSTPSFKNTLFYGNFNGNGKEFYLGDITSDPFIDHCDLQGGINALGGPGGGTSYTVGNYTNNIDLAPLFVSPSAGTGSGYNGLTADWSLQSTSPCINAGDITGVASLLPALDLGGNLRINGVIDMGAYEFGCTPVPVSVTIAADQNSVCAGTTVTFTATSTNGGTAPAYQWKKNGSNVGSNAPTYAYVPVNGDAITCVLTSDLTCTTGNPATSNSIAQTVNPLPMADAGSNQSIGYGAAVTLNGSAIGGSGNYTYHWEPASMLVNPNVQNPNTVNLTSSIQFTLTVTDVTSGCTGTDQVLVTITGGALSVVATATPGTSCAGNPVQLMALTGGGTGNYTYSWTSQPAGFTSTIQNPVATPLETTHYTVVVNDGNATVIDLVLVTVNPLPLVPIIPTGPDRIDLVYVTQSEYTIPALANTNSYVWELTPANAGSINGTGTSGAVTWNPTFMGNAEIRVKSVNGCGESVWSESRVTEVDNTVGTDAISSGLNCTLFPNPAYEDFTLLISEGTFINFVKVTLYDAVGQKIKEVSQNFNSFKSISLAGLPAGIYWVRIDFEQKSFTKKVIKL